MSQSALAVEEVLCIGFNPDARKRRLKAEWGVSENNRRARCTLTKADREQLEQVGRV
jgi:hypothetical protein